MEPQSNPLHIFRAVLDDIHLWANNKLVNSKHAKVHFLLMEVGHIFGQLEEAAHQHVPDFDRLGQLVSDLHHVWVTHCQMNAEEAADSLAELRTLIEVWKSGKTMTKHDFFNWYANGLSSVQLEAKRFSIAEKLDASDRVIFCLRKKP